MTIIPLAQLDAARDYPYAAWRLLAWLRTMPAQTPAQMAVLAVLLAHINARTGACFLKVETICTTSRLSRRAVFGALAELEAAGVLVRRRQRWQGRQAATRYALPEAVRIVLASFGRQTPA